MPEPAFEFPFAILLVGLLIALVMLLKPALARLRVPALVGFIALGVLLRLADDRWGVLTWHEDAGHVLEFMAGIGVVVLLFRVGLESNVAGLVRQFPRAAPVWVGNVAVSAAAGFLVAYGVLGLALVPSLFVATALTATSVSVPLAVWRDAGALNSRTGEVLLDVAGLDDVSAVILMAVLLALAPALVAGGPAGPWSGVATAAALPLLKLLAVAALCVLFSRYVERPVTTYFAPIEPPFDLMLLVVGTALVMAAGVVALGFSLAIGALFAGLAFSRDRKAIQVDRWLSPLYDLFAPFFFIGIGLAVSPGALAPAVGLGSVLLAVAVLGKGLGAGVPALFTSGTAGAVLIGVSMIPRAEIALVVMQQGMSLGDRAVPAALFDAVVLVSAATCIAVPLALRPLLDRWPQRQDRRA